MEDKHELPVALLQLIHTVMPGYMAQLKGRCAALKEQSEVLQTRLEHSDAARLEDARLTPLRAAATDEFLYVAELYARAMEECAALFGFTPDDPAAVEKYLQ